ncbi:MAG: hypothetical protein Q7I92_13855, partial [Humidesulfovibrio sp.]|nr:hypothetical protein [Humidesulfovibrio sp.]
PATEALPEEPRTQAPAPAKAQETQAELHDVIGRPGVQVSMAEALERPDLYVVTENFEIWDRSYHQGIHKPADR